MLSLVLISAVYKLGWRKKNSHILEMGSDSGCLHSVVGEQLIRKCGGLGLALSYAENWACLWEHPVLFAMMHLPAGGEKRSLYKSMD